MDARCWMSVHSLLYDVNFLLKFVNSTTWSGMSDSFSLMYAGSGIGVLRYKSLTSMVANHAPGVDMTLLNRSLVVILSAVGVQHSPT